jgi:hypothetical protein
MAHIIEKNKLQASKFALDFANHSAKPNVAGKEFSSMLDLHQDFAINLLASP